MQCRSCGFENPEGMKFCNGCGATLKNRCLNCGFENPPQAKFCGECGISLTEQSQQPKSQRKDEPERRQLTVMFCDLVGSTALSEQLDPEELRDVVRIYQEVCAEVIDRFEGHIAQYLGDGLLVYFGYPLAHEDDAQRAMRAGLEIVGVIHELPLHNTRLQQSLRVRIGIHTGPVVVGEIGRGERREQLALGDTLNIASRLQDLAEPNTVVISSVTYRLTEGLFECRDLGLHRLKGVSAPVQMYRILGESAVRSRFEVAITKGLTPLVGREQEVGLLLERWEKVKEGMGQVVLLCGEPGIGKSRLMQVLKERLSGETHVRIESRCSPYYQNSALYPIIDQLQRLLFRKEDSPEEKLSKLEVALVGAQYFKSAPTEAETCFRQAIDIARSQSAKSLELRSVMSLSRLWQKQGKKEKARQMLAEIYGWFTEGFDTCDLKEAKILLDELS